jgi:hypothetical protein
LEPYRVEVVAAWHAAQSESERKEIVADVNGLLEWARITTLSSRTHAQNKLLLLHRDNAYSGAARGRQAFSLEA